MPFHLVRLCLLLFAVTLPAVTVHLYPFGNSDDPELAQMAQTIQEILARKITDRHLTVEGRQQSDERVSSTHEISVIYGTISRDSAGILISAVIETGPSQARFEKNIRYAPDESLEQNIESLSRKIFHVYQDKFFSMLQIITSPEACTLSLNGKAMGTTPYEALYPVGRAALKLSKTGFVTLSDDIRVVPGHNRYAFSLKPPKAKLWKKWYTYTFVAGWAIFAGSFYWHAQYRDELNAYNEVRAKPADQSKFDRHHDAAERAYTIRNAGFVISFGLVALSSLNLKRYFFSE